MFNFFLKVIRSFLLACLIASKSFITLAAVQESYFEETIAQPSSNVVSINVEHSMSTSIPEIALGYEEDYLHFINGKLIYRPDPDSDIGSIEFPFSQFADTLEGEFNLYELTFTDTLDKNKIKNVDQYLRIKNRI